MCTVPSPSSAPRHPIWTLTEGDGPILATAIHHGHEVRKDVQQALLLSESERLREEDPYTGCFTTVGNSSLVVHRSRFEVDMNRPREKAVYLTPEDAWGLSVWKESPGENLLGPSLSQYDAFYQMLSELLTRIKKRYPRFIVLDIHSYNHHRLGPLAPFDSPECNPEIDVGTDTLSERGRFSHLIDGFVEDLRGFNFMGRGLDVRENIRFGNGWMGEWIHQNFKNSACVLSIEFKKTFMDEWTGELDQPIIDTLQSALGATIPGLMRRLHL